MKTREQIEERLEFLKEAVKKLDTVSDGYVLNLIQIEKDTLEQVLESCPN